MKNQRGFTLIELMIATTVFSMILLLCTFGLIQISRYYYKGLTMARTQEVARNITDQISQAIQFSGGDVKKNLTNPDGTLGFCIGNQEYSYQLGKQLVDSSPDTAQGQVLRAFMVREITPCSEPQGLVDGNAEPNSRELLSPKMRIAALKVEPLPGASDLWQVEVRIVYGDSDLLVVVNGNTECSNAIAGREFCAVSELKTLVQRRIN